jgi:hypothetical protein
MSRAQDAQLALLCGYAEDAYDAVGGGQVSPDPRVAAAWKIHGTLIGQDALLRKSVELADRRVFYGWLLEAIAHPGEFVLVIRGTAGAIEWAIDAEFCRRPHPLGGLVEDGFFGLYQTLALQLPSSQLPLAAALASIVGDGQLIIAGHSLGATLATFAATRCALHRLPAPWRWSLRGYFWKTGARSPHVRERGRHCAHRALRLRLQRCAARASALPCG